MSQLGHFRKLAPASMRSVVPRGLTLPHRSCSAHLGVMSMARHRQISFQPSVADLGMYGTVHLSGRHFPSRIGRTCHEIAVKICRDLSCRDPVNCIVVRPERHGNVANRNRLRHRAPQHLGRSAEAGGKATKAEPGGKHRRVSPDIANRLPDIANRAIACARFSVREDCQA